MQNKIIIDQKKFVQYENLDLVDVAIYDLLQHFARNIQNHTINITAQEIINQLPLLRIQSRQRVYRKLKNLEDAGLIILSRSKGNRYQITIKALKKSMSIREKYSFEYIRRKNNNHEVRTVQEGFFKISGK